jgi:superfamily II DNA or RNA helicase
MKFLQGNIWTQLVNYSTIERLWVDEYTSCEMSAYYAGGWGAIDGSNRFRMMHVLTNQFPSGLLPMILVDAAKAGFLCEVEDIRGPAPCFIDDFADLDWLRDYQKAAAWAAADAGRGLIKVPTAGGKTEIFVGLTRILPCEWLFVVHRSSLTGQGARRFELRTGEKAGEWSGGEWHPGSANVTVSTFQALHSSLRSKDAKVKKRCKEFLSTMRAICVDEVHGVPADSFYKVAMSMPNCYYRFGLSGTPLDRGDKETLRTIGAIGPLVYKIKAKVLADAGVLTMPTVYMIPCKQEGTTSADWHTTYRQFIVESTVRNALVVEMTKRAVKPCLLFVDQLDHGLDLMSQLEHQGFRVGFVHGEHWEEKRSQFIKELVDAKIDVLISTVVFQEGVDIPELESIVNAGGKASTVGVLQRMGRGMRVAKGKSGFEVWDIKDRGQEWLQNHANDRLKAYKKAGHTPIMNWPPAQKTLPGIP